MRLDAREGAHGWATYHARRCEMLHGVVWVDNDVARWAQHLRPLVVLGGQLILVVHQATRIDIHVDRRLVIIDPVEDQDREAVERTEAVVAAADSRRTPGAPSFAGPSQGEASTGAKRLEIASVFGPLQSELCGVRGAAK